MRRLLYLVYYLKETDIQKLKAFVNVARERTGRSSVMLCLAAIADSFRYNISLLDYFYFRFFEKSRHEKEHYAGTGFMYEYQLKMNPLSSREVLEDKIRFLNKFSQFVNREYASIEELKTTSEAFGKLTNNKSGKLVLKGSRGQVGAQVRVVSSTEFTEVNELVQYMQQNEFDLAEEYVIQHESLMRISASGLNTVRVISQVHNGKVIILAARLRISINSPVDNMAAGNVAAPVDIETGIVIGDAVYSDISKPKESVHPLTGAAIRGFQIPYWDETKNMVYQAALVEPGNRSVGWDVAIAEDGPQLIEGNHNWCKLLWQLPVNQGLKKQLLPYQ